MWYMKVNQDTQYTFSNGKKNNNKHFFKVSQANEVKGNKVKFKIVLEMPNRLHTFLIFLV